VTIRLVREDEWTRARSLRLQAVADAPDALGSSLEEGARLSEADWRERVASSDSRVSFVEATGDEFVAMAVGVLDHPSKTASLRAMWVDPSHRRTGIGKRLVETVTQWARQRGAARIELEVSETAAPAIALYQACGFRPTGHTRSLPSNPGVSAVQMARKIEQVVGRGRSPGPDFENVL
jgi:GNAT superfamily N-acetyltransferase